MASLLTPPFYGTAEAVQKLIYNPEYLTYRASYLSVSIRMI
jgi:hypothetical protein